MASKGLACPVCGKPREKFDPTESALPFCSMRCKQADLGKWMAGHYTVSRPLNLDEVIEVEMQLDNEEDSPFDRN